MRQLEFGDRMLCAVLGADPTEAQWLEARAAGVTASEVHEIAHGGIGARSRVLYEKLNGSTFRGSAATAAGHENEPRILAAAELIEGVLMLIPTPRLLLAHPEHPRHMATPDGLGISSVFGEFGVEAKWHEAGWTHTGIPADHLSQCQWGMHVTGFSWWLYVWLVDGAESISWEWVPRDDRRIGKLAAEADAFNEWRDAGAPRVDDLDPALDDAIADYVRGLELESEGKALKAAARPVIDRYVADSRDGDRTVRAAGTRGAIASSVTVEDVLDEDAWERRAPKAVAAYRARVARHEAEKARLEEIAAEAALTYHRTETRVGPLRVTPNKGKAA